MKHHNVRTLDWVRCMVVGTVMVHTLPACASVEELAALSLEDLMKVEVSSASKYAQNASEAPSSVTVVSREDIRRFGWRNLAEVLAAQRGFHTYYDRSYHYVGVRGFAPPGDYNSRIQFLVNGMRLNDNLYDSVMAGESFPLDLDLVERIEIIRGPGASMYGGNALFGVINLITRSGESIDGTEVAADFGSQNTTRLRASAGGHSGDLHWLISASGYGSSGGRYEFPDVAPGRLSPDGGDADRAEKLFARMQVGDWYGQLTYSDRSKHRPGGQWGSVFDDPGLVERDAYTIGELGGRRNVGWQQELDFRIFAGEYLYNTVAPLDYSATGGASYNINRDDQIGRWWGSEVKWTSSALAGQKWVAGITYVKNTQQFMRNADDGGTVYDPVTNISSDRYGLYAQDEIALSDATTLMLGLRHDTVESRERFTSPRLALVHHLNTDHTVKLLYGGAFRTPNVYERYYPNVGTPSLKQETTQSLEAVWEGRIDSQTRGTVSLYRYTMDNTIAFDLTSRPNINSPSISASGGEFELERRWSNGALLRGSYSAQFLSQDGQRPDNAPTGIIQVLGGMPLGSSGMFAAVEMRGMTARNAASGTSTVDGYAVANATLSWRPSGSPWEWSASIYNLFDRRFDDPAAVDPQLVDAGLNRDRFAQDGRSFRLKAIARF